MKRTQVRPIIVPNSELDGIHTVEIVVRKSMKQPWLMAGLDLESLGNPHDQRPEKIDGHHPALLRLPRQRFDDFSFNKAEHHQRTLLLRQLDHPGDLRDRPSVPEDSKPPTVTKLNHRGANRRAAGIPRAVGNDEYDHVIRLGCHGAGG